MFCDMFTAYCSPVFYDRLARANQISAYCHPTKRANVLKIVSVVKPTRCTIFEFIEYHSTCFGRSFHSSSGVQDCTYSIRCVSYRLVNCLKTGTKWNGSSISCPLLKSQLTCMTYT